MQSLDRFTSLHPGYRKSATELADFEALDPGQRKHNLFSRFKEMTQRVYVENKFYRHHYREHGFNPDTLQSFADIARVPVVTKADLREFDLDERSTPSGPRLHRNTGGTSGEPLHFYIPKSFGPRELAYMHYIWRQIGYRPGDLRLVFRGAFTGPRSLQLRPARGEIHVNAYRPWDETIERLNRMDRLFHFAFLHGYPSILADFSAALLHDDSGLLERFRARCGVILSSEFPAPHYRRTIEETFSRRTLAFYGHSEKAILAYEDGENQYKPLMSYGLAEAVDGVAGVSLVATSLDNQVSPFIRYDTGDMVEAEHKDGLLQRFSVTDGRVGDFILDNQGRRISLTALIFGRHHSLFSSISHVQVHQSKPGEATLYVVPQSGQGLPRGEGFNLQGVGVDFQVVARPSPFRTAAGKAPLLLPRKYEAS